MSPVHQPGVCNIEKWDGRQWHGGMNRLTETEAIDVARRWGDACGDRYRVFDLEGRVIFDTADTGVLALLREMKLRHAGGYPLPPFGPLVDAVAGLSEASAQVIRAFENLGTANGVVPTLQARNACEAALVALKDAHSRAQGSTA